MQHRILLQSLLICFITICLSLSLQESKKAIIGDNKQWNDTKNTFGTVNRLINDNFLPENEPVTEPTTPDSNTNVSTTEAPYRITRTEFNRILRRNLRGLQRLFQIELQDALKQSDLNYIEFKKNASKEISKFL